MKQYRRDLTQDLRIGIRIGVLCATACSLMATTGYVLSYFGGGSKKFAVETGVSFPTILCIYAGGWLVGGILIGLLRPLRSTAWGSFFIGTVSSLPVCLGFVSLMLGPRAWYPAGFIIAAMTAMIIGGGLGAVFHDRTKGWTQWSKP